MLANLGGAGRRTGNMVAELWTHIKPPAISNALGTMTVFLKLGAMNALRIARCDHLLVLPHLLFSIVYHEHKELFMSSFCGGSLDNVKKSIGDKLNLAVTLN